MQQTHMVVLSVGTVPALSFVVPRFISLQATDPLGLPDNARQEVEVKICDLPGPRWDSFAAAKATVLEQLRKVRT